MTVLLSTVELTQFLHASRSSVAVTMWDVCRPVIDHYADAAFYIK